MGAGGATSAANRARRTEPPPQASHAISTAARSSGTRSSTRSSMTTRVSRTPRSTTTRPRSPPSPSCTALSAGSPSAASPSNASCRTTAAPTGHTCGVTPVRRCRSRRRGPARTAPRRTGRWSASTGPWPTGGPTLAATPASTNAATHCPTGSTTTTRCVRTPRAPTSRPSHD